MLPDMKVAALLIITWIPFAQAGGPGSASCAGCVIAASHDEVAVSPLVLQWTRGATFPNDPNRGCFVVPFEDEEDPVEDILFAHGHLHVGWRPDPRHRDLVGLAQVHQDLRRISHQPPPLRC